MSFFRRKKKAKEIGQEQQEPGKKKEYKPLLSKSEINTSKKLLNYKDNPLYNLKLSHKIEHMPLDSLVKLGYIHDGDDILRYINQMDNMLKGKSAYNRKDWDIIQKSIKKSKKKRYNLQKIFDSNNKSMARVLNYFNINEKLGNGSANPLYYLDENMLTTFMVYECVPKGTRRVGPKGKRHFIYYTPEAKVELLDIMLTAGYDPTRLPSLNDKTISVGAFQFRRSTFNSLEKLYPKLFGGKNYIKLLETFSGQSLMAAALLYDNVLYFNRNIFAKSERLRKLFTDASIHDKRRFLVSVVAAMYNSGPTDVRNVLNGTTLKKKHKNLEALRQSFIKDMYNAGGTISAPYAEFVGELYSHVEEKNHYYAASGIVEKAAKEAGAASSQKIFPFELAYTVSGSDALFMGTSKIGEKYFKPAGKGIEEGAEKGAKKEIEEGIAMGPPKPAEKSIIKYKPILGKPGKLLLRSSKNMEYYTFTLPLDWEEKDLAVLLTDKSRIKDVNRYNEQDKVEKGNYFFLPVDYMDENLRDGSFATIHVKGKIDKGKLEDVAKEYCSGNKKKNALLIRIYTNIVDFSDFDRKSVRIPTGILKDKYKHKYVYE